MLRSAGKQSVDSVESVSQRCLAPLRCQQAISLVKMPPAAAALLLLPLWCVNVTEDGTFNA